MSIINGSFLTHNIDAEYPPFKSKANIWYLKKKLETNSYRKKRRKGTKKEMDRTYNFNILSDQIEDPNKLANKHGDYPSKSKLLKLQRM